MKERELEEMAIKLQEQLLKDCDCEYHTQNLIGKGNVPEKLNCSIAGCKTITYALKSVHDEAVEASAKIIDSWHIKKGGYCELSNTIRQLKEK